MTYFYTRDVRVLCFTVIHYVVCAQNLRENNYEH
jgi:hypothetical protein